MNYSRTDKEKLSKLADIAQQAQFRQHGFFSPEATADRRRMRRERDLARGYSVNVKQVMLAFAVEFWIIGLIIAGTYLLIAESGERGRVSTQEVFSALLLPAALAMVELARVPLAIAVRTQPTWHIKFFASLGVLAAITVTSFSLSQIAWKTFDIRTAEATRVGEKVLQIRATKAEIQNRIAQAQRDLAQKIQDRDSVSKRITGLEDQITKVGFNSQKSCKLLFDGEGKPKIGGDGKQASDCTSSTTANQAQINALKTQLATATKERDAAQADVKQQEDEAKSFDLQQVERELTAAEADYRSAVNKSQLYSYAGMLTGKAGADVTDADVKRLEKFLIIIPAIAAAFASTLLAVTAVRRIKPPAPPPMTAIPDEAAEYLFGPLLEAIRMEARKSVAVALNGHSDTKAPASATPG